MSKLKATIAGAGLIAGKKHIPAFLKQHGKVELVALCDLNLQAAQKTANDFGIRKTYGDFSELLSKEQPDLVDICTPPGTHARLAVEAMKHGCHVLIEKPMALTVVDCDKIVNASRQYKVKVCVAHSDLFYYPFIKAREVVRNGGIGEFRGMRIFLSTPTDYMTSHKEHWVHKLPGGVIGETGPHVAYMTLAFIKPVREVQVKTAKILEYPWSQAEDYRIDLIGDKAISSVTLAYASDQWMARLDILGSEGTLLLDLQSLSFVRYSRLDLNPSHIGLSVLRESWQSLFGTITNGIRFLTGSLRSTHDVLVGAFVDSIITGTEPPVPAEEGREAVRVVNMIIDSLSEKYGPALTEEPESRIWGENHREKPTC